VGQADVSGGTMVERSIEERSLDEVAEEIVGLAARLAASLCRWLELVAEFDRREGWASSGCHSCAHWLSWKCGVALQTAREQVRVARALEGLPLVRVAFGRGTLSYTKVRALVRMCTPDTEADLVELAKVATGEHLNRIAAGYARATEDPDEDTPRPSVRWHWDDDGQLRVSATLDPESGRAFLVAMHQAARLVAGPPAPAQVDAAAVARGMRVDSGELREAGLVAAFETMVQMSLAAAADEGAVPPPPDLVVAVSIDDLQRDRTDPGVDPVVEPCCDVAADGASNGLRPGRERHHRTRPRQRRPRFRLRAPTRRIEPRVAQRLSCDATLTTLMHDSRGTPLDLGRRQRTVNHALRTALTLRDGGCRFPGCGHTRFVQAHHIVHWAHGGPTCLDNLITLCRFHHRVVHDRALTIAYALDGSVQFVDAGGRVLADDRVATSAGVGATGDLPAAVGSIEPTWGGERLDLALAIDAILSAEVVARRRAEHAAAAA
jgi:hypothetical protein